MARLGRGSGGSSPRGERESLVGKEVVAEREFALQG